MYKVEIETPKGTIIFNIWKIEELGKYLVIHPDYTGVKVKRIGTQTKGNKKWKKGKDGNMPTTLEMNL